MWVLVGVELFSSHLFKPQYLLIIPNREQRVVFINLIGKMYLYIYTQYLYDVEAVKGEVTLLYHEG